MSASNLNSLSSSFLMWKWDNSTHPLWPLQKLYNQSCVHFLSNPLLPLFQCSVLRRLTILDYVNGLPHPLDSSWPVGAPAGDLRARGAWGQDNYFSSSLPSGWPLRKATAALSWLSSHSFLQLPVTHFFPLLLQIFLHLCK